MDKLHITENGKEAQTRSLGQAAYTIGRLPDNDIVLPEDSVSSRHARLERHTSGWQIIDLQSTNGTYLNQQKLQPASPQNWAPHTPLFIGPYTLLWQPVPVPGEVASTPPASQPTAQTQSTNLGDITLEPISVQLAPGETREIVVNAVNEARHVEQYSIEIDGLPESWVTFAQTRVQLMPDLQKTAFKFQIRVPQQGVTAKTYPYRLVLRSVADQREEGCAYGNVLVSPVPDYKAVLKPPTIKNRGNCQVVIHNQGNASADYLVSGYSDSPAVRFDKSTQVVSVPAGQEERVVLAVSATKRPFTGKKAEPHSFNVAVVSSQGDGQNPGGKLEIWPLLSTRLLVFLALLFGFPVACSANSLRGTVQTVVDAATATMVAETEATRMYREGQTATATAVTATAVAATQTREAMATQEWIATATAAVEATNAAITPDPEPTAEPTPTPLPNDHNILPNPSFEGGHYHPTDESGNEILELQVPEGWFVEAFDGPNSLQGGAGFFYRPEIRVLQAANLPESEQNLLIFDGQQTLKAFKGFAPTAFTLYTEIILPQPGRYRLSINVFPDVIVGYKEGQKIFDTRSLSSEVSLIYGAGLRTNWSNVSAGGKSTVSYEFIIETPGPVIVGASFRNRYEALNNGWFLDDWSLTFVQPLESREHFPFFGMSTFHNQPGLYSRLSTAAS